MKSSRKRLEKSGIVMLPLGGAVSGAAQVVDKMLAI